jgi:hypothetical protein
MGRDELKSVPLPRSCLTEIFWNSPFAPYKIGAANYLIRTALGIWLLKSDSSSDHYSGSA